MDYRNPFQRRPTASMNLSETIHVITAITFSRVGQSSTKCIAESVRQQQLTHSLTVTTSQLTGRGEIKSHVRNK